MYTMQAKKEHMCTQVVETSNLFLVTNTTKSGVPHIVFPNILYTCRLIAEKTAREKWPELGHGQNCVTLPYRRARVRCVRASAMTHRRWMSELSILPI